MYVYQQEQSLRMPLDLLSLVILYLVNEGLLMAISKTSNLLILFFCNASVISCGLYQVQEENSGLSGSVCTALLDTLANAR